MEIETFVVGHDIASGERLQWIVEGGKFKASFLLPDAPAKGDGEKGEGTGGVSEGGLLISETVVPGFEFADHDFLGAEGFEGLVRGEERGELRFLVRREEEEA